MLRSQHKNSAMQTKKNLQSVSLTKVKTKSLRGVDSARQHYNIGQYKESKTSLQKIRPVQS